MNIDKFVINWQNFSRVRLQLKFASSLSVFISFFLVPKVRFKDLKFERTTDKLAIKWQNFAGFYLAQVLLL